MVFNLVFTVKTNIMIKDFDHYILEKLTLSVLDPIPFSQVPYTFVDLHGTLIMYATLMFIFKIEIPQFACMNVAMKYINRDHVGLIIVQSGQDL
jgi:hypothetical protein